MGDDEFDEKGVSNNSFFRGISNLLDLNPLIKYSSLRSEIHALYHAYVAFRKKLNGNDEGAAAEFKRAMEQKANALVRRVIPFPLNTFINITFPD